MLHRYLEIDKEDAIIKEINRALYVIKCPVCRKNHGSAMSKNLLPDFLFCYGNPSHNDWRKYKKEKKLTNKKIAQIIGSTPDSIKNMTQTNKPLPKWAISMLYEWVNGA